MGFFKRKKKKDFVDLTNSSENFQEQQKRQFQKRVREKAPYENQGTSSGGYRDFTKNPSSQETSNFQPGYQQPTTQYPNNNMNQTSNPSSNPSSASYGGVNGFFGGFFGGDTSSQGTNTSSPTSYEDTQDQSPEGRRRRFTKRLKDMTERMEDLSNQLYNLQQRLELIERKMDIR